MIAYFGGERDGLTGNMGRNISGPFCNNIGTTFGFVIGYFVVLSVSLWEHFIINFGINQFGTCLLYDDMTYFE